MGIHIHTHYVHLCMCVFWMPITEYGPQTVLSNRTVDEGMHELRLSPGHVGPFSKGLSPFKHWERTKISASLWGTFWQRWASRCGCRWLGSDVLTWGLESDHWSHEATKVEQAVLWAMRGCHLSCPFQTFSKKVPLTRETCENSVTWRKVIGKAVTGTTGNI